MQIEINDIDLREKGYSEQDIKELIAMAFYEKNIWGSAQAAAFCNIGRLAFQKKLADKKNPFQFDDKYWDEELGAIDKLAVY